VQSLLLHIMCEHAEEVQLYGHCIVVQWLNLVCKTC
jgi:hypothetical protein